MSLFEKIRIVIKEENAEDSKKSKAQNYTDKINRKNKNRKEFEFDPKTKERQTFKGKISSGPDKGKGYTIFRRDGGDVKKGVDKGVIPKAAKGSPIEVKSPAHKDLFKRYNKGEPKATQFMIDLAKDDRKARGLGKRAERVKDASGGKKTGSLRKGNLSFPGDRTGAYSRTKSEIEFNKALKKARGNTEGDLPKEAPQDVVDYAKKVRDKRIKKYKLPDTSFDAKPSKKPIRPFGDAPVKTGIDKPTVPKKKTFKVFSQGTRKKAIDDIRASDKRLYDAGVGKKPSLVQQRKFAKAAFKKAQQKQQAEFNKQQRLAKMYDVYDDGDLGNPEIAKKTPKKVKFSSGAKGKFTSGSVDLGDTDKKFANRKRTPAPQVTRKITNFDAKSVKPTTGGKVTNSKGIGNMFRGKENKAAKQAAIDISRGKTPTTSIPKLSGSVTRAKVTSDYDRVQNVRSRAKAGQYYQKDLDIATKASPKTGGSKIKFSKFDKFAKKIKDSKLGGLALKGIKKNKYVAAAAAVAGGYGLYSALKPKKKTDTLSFKNKNIVAGPTVKDSSGKPKYFKLGKTLTPKDLENTNYSKK